MYIEYTKLSETEGKVMVIDYVNEPSEPNQVAVNKIPEPVYSDDKVPVLHYNLQSKELFYRYEDRELTRDELLDADMVRLKEENERLKSSVAFMEDMLVILTMP